MRKSAEFAFAVFLQYTYIYNKVYIYIIRYIYIIGIRKNVRQMAISALLYYNRIFFTTTPLLVLTRTIAMPLWAGALRLMMPCPLAEPIRRPSVL